MLKKFIALAAVFIIVLAYIIPITLATTTPSSKPSDFESLPSDCESIIDSEISDIFEGEASVVPDISDIDVSTPDDSVSEDIDTDASEDMYPPEESIDNPTEEPSNEPLPEDPGELPDETSDIIDNLTIRLYNDYAEGFNLVDGETYIQDIAALLKKYAPEGLRISAGCAMAYTEGGSGKKGIYTYTNNCFGIRAYSTWSGYVYARSTGLVYKDYATAVAAGAYDFFKAYESMEESVQDYVALMSSSRYNAVIGMDRDADYFNYVLIKGYGEAHLSSSWLYLVDLYNLTQYNIITNEELEETSKEINQRIIRVELRQ